MAYEYTFEEIEEYLDGTLSQEEKLRFEWQVNADPVLAGEVKKHRQLRKLNELHARNKLKDKVRDIFKREKEEEQSTSGGFPFMKIAAAIALFIVAGMSYFYLSHTYSADGMVESAFEPYPNRYRTMGDEVEGVFMKAMEHYDTENYQEAVELFSIIPEEDRYYLPARFYMGVSYLVLKDHSDAIEALLEAKDKSELYKDAAQWYLSLAYIENGEEAAAKGILHTIVDENGYQAEEARVILKRLDSPVRKLPGIE